MQGWSYRKAWSYMPVYAVLLFANRAQIVELGIVICLCTFKANTIL